MILSASRGSKPSKAVDVLVNVARVGVAVAVQVIDTEARPRIEGSTLIGVRP